MSIQKNSKRPGLNDMAKIREFFNVYDQNHDGVISKLELQQMLSKMGVHMSQRGIDAFFDQIDVDHSGEIEFSEFVDWYTTLMDLADQEAQKMLESLLQRTTFTRTELEAIYDNYKRVSASVVNDGCIDAQEFRQMMVAGGVPSWNSFLLDGLFKMSDVDGSGNISFEEFVVLLSTFHNKTRSASASSEKHRLLFQIYDVDKDGRISKQDLTKILSDCLQSNNLVLQEADLMALVEATFARAGCGPDGMDLKAYMKEVVDRRLL